MTLGVDVEWMRRVLKAPDLAAVESNRVAFAENLEELLDVYALFRKIETVIATSPRGAPHHPRSELVEVVREIVEEHAECANIVDAIRDSEAVGWQEKCAEIRERLRQYAETKSAIERSNQPDPEDGIDLAVEGMIDRIADLEKEKEERDDEANALAAVRDAARELIEDIDERRGSVHPLFPLRSALREAMRDDARAPLLKFD